MKTTHRVCLLCSLILSALAAAGAENPLNDPFIESVSALPPEQQVAAVIAKLKELNPKFDGKETHRIFAGQVMELRFSTVGVTDISPVRALSRLQSLCITPPALDQKGSLADLSPLRGMQLKSLWCINNPITDLSPLKGLPLSALGIFGTRVSDLSPLTGMKLHVLNVNDTDVSDLGPLKGMPLSKLFCRNTKVTDLTPLKTTPLSEIQCDFVAERDAAVLRSIKTLWKINKLSAAMFAGGENPLDDPFIKSVSALPPEQQVAAVIAKLKELNPKFDGKETHQIFVGQVIEIEFSTVGVTDISPVRALCWLQSLRITPPALDQRGSLADLSPLRGLQLELLWCCNNPITNLSPLKGMPLSALGIFGTRVSDLSPLTGMKLQILNFNDTAVSDLGPLKGMPLTKLCCRNTKVTDLTPLKTTRLSEIQCDFVAERDEAALRSIRTLWEINGLPAATLAGAENPLDDPFIKSVSALPPEQQVAAVIAKLKELNPKFDGKETHQIFAGQVMELRFSTVGVTDISPVRALSRLQSLRITPPALDQKGSLAELSPLRGMQLELLWCINNPITDLSPLKGMPLSALGIFGTRVSDLSPLTGMKLQVLNVNHTAVSDLGPLKGMPLTKLFCHNTKVTDLMPLKTTPLSEIQCDFVAERDAAVLRSIETLRKINDLPAATLWKRVRPVAVETAPTAK